MLEIYSQSPQHPSLLRFENSLVSYLHCSDDLKLGVQQRPKQQAIAYPYLELFQRKRNYLALDVDRSMALFTAIDSNLPPPTLIVENHRNKHAHLLYELESPVSFGKRSKQHPQDFFNAIRIAYTEKAKADAGFVHYLAKNPLHSRWNTFAYDKAYTLQELADWVTLKPRSKINIQALGRNSTLFETLRHWAYRAAPSASSHESLFNSIEAEAEKLNQTFNPPLPYSEVKATAKSVAKFCWEHRHEFGQHVGKMGFAPISLALSVEDRQAEEVRREIAGGQFRGQQKVEASQARIAQALQPLHGQSLHARYVRDFLVNQCQLRAETVFKRFPLSLGMIQIP